MEERHSNLNPLFSFVENSTVGPALNKENIKHALEGIEDPVTKLTYIEEVYRLVKLNQTAPDKDKAYITEAGSFTATQMQDIWNLKLAYLETILTSVNDLEAQNKRAVAFKDKLRLFFRKILNLKLPDSIMDFDMSDWLPNNRLMLNSRNIFNEIMKGGKEVRADLDEFLKKEDIAPEPIWGDRAIAEVMIFSYANGESYLKDSNQLLDLLQEQNAEKLAEWLTLHSFVKWRVEQEIKKNGYKGGEVPIELLNAVVTIVQDYSEEMKIKATLPKFTVADVGKDYLDTYKNLAKTLFEKNRTRQSALTINSLNLLVNAKNRRSEALGRYFHGESAGDAYHRNFDQLTDKIMAMKSGERKQLFYMHGTPHVLSFDVEKDAAGKLHIFCFESARDPNTLKTLDLLTQALQNQKIDFEVKSCVSGLQADVTNCSIYSLAVMNELAKYPHVFDYLPATLSAPHDEAIAAIKGGYRLPGIEGFVFDKSIEAVQWVNIEEMPTKLIAMSQSYGDMKERLATVVGFDQDVDAFVKMHKQKYDYPDESHAAEMSKEELQNKKYISRKRERISERLDTSKTGFLQQQMETIISRNPFMAHIDKPSFIEEYNNYVANNDKNYTKQLKQLAEMFKIISLHYANQFKDDSTSPDIELSKNLLFLRNQYLELLIKHASINEITAIIENVHVGDRSILSSMNAIIDLNSEKMKNDSQFLQFEDLAGQLCDKLSSNIELSSLDANYTCLAEIYMHYQQGLSHTLADHIIELLVNEIKRQENKSSSTVSFGRTEKIQELRNLQDKISSSECKDMSIDTLIDNLLRENKTTALAFLKKIKHDYPGQKLKDPISFKQNEEKLVKKT